jgi:hypothetical protein
MNNIQNGSSDHRDTKPISILLFINLGFYIPEEYAGSKHVWCSFGHRCCASPSCPIVCYGVHIEKIAADAEIGKNDQKEPKNRMGHYNCRTAKQYNIAPSKFWWNELTGRSSSLM